MNPFNLGAHAPLTTRNGGSLRPPGEPDLRQVDRTPRREVTHPDLPSRLRHPAPPALQPVLRPLKASDLPGQVDKRLAMLPMDAQRAVAQAIATLIRDARALSGPALVQRLRQEQQGIDMSWRTRAPTDWVLVPEADQRNIIHADLWGQTGACLLRRDEAEFKRHLDEVERATSAVIQPRSRPKKTLADVEVPDNPSPAFDPLRSGIRLNGVWTTKADLARGADQPTGEIEHHTPFRQTGTSPLSGCVLGAVGRPDDLLPFVRSFDDGPGAAQTWLDRALVNGTLAAKGEGLAYAGRALFTLVPPQTGRTPAQPLSAQLFYRSSGANSSMADMLLPASGLGAKISKPDVAEMTGNFFNFGHQDADAYVEELGKSFSHPLLVAHCRDLMAFAKSKGVSDWGGLDHQSELSQQDIKAVYKRLVEHKRQLGKSELVTQDGFLTRFGQDAYLALAVADQQRRDPKLSLREALGINPNDSDACRAHVCDYLETSPEFQSHLKEAKACLQAQGSGAELRATESPVPGVGMHTPTLNPRYTPPMEVIQEVPGLEDDTEDLNERSPADQDRTKEPPTVLTTEHPNAGPKGGPPAERIRTMANEPHLVNMMARAPACLGQLDLGLKPEVLDYAQGLRDALTQGTPHVLLIEQLQGDARTGNAAATWVHGLMRSGNGFCGLGGESAEKFHAKLIALQGLLQA